MTKTKTFKRFLLVLALVGASSVPTFAQETRDRSVYLELFGPSNMVGVSYDARFKPGSKWGYRAGVGYSYGMSEGFFLYDSKSHSVTAPLEVNYLAGSKRSQLELGAGASLGVYHESCNVFYFDWLSPEGTGETVHYSSTCFGYYLYGNIGYRHTSKKGFQFRCGVSPYFNFGDKHGVKKDPAFYPYVSFGYAF